MEFTTNIFLIFVILFFAIYYFLFIFRVGNGILNLYISVSSLAFYGTWYPPVIGIILYLIVLSRWGGVFLEKTSHPKVQKIGLGTLVGFSLIPLVFFKYYNFLVQEIFQFKSNEMDIILPVGISFYTFTVIGYLVDVYRRDISASRSISNVNFLITFWPHLAAGPILRAGNVFRYLNKRARLNSYNIGFGFLMLMMGLGKKFLIADVIGNYIQWNMNHGLESMPSMDVWILVVGFSCQIYADFSGYSDMAIAFALFMGIRLPANFNYPYRSQSLTEFWNRWHISLSTWFRDYVYFPLGGSKTSSMGNFFNIMVVFLISGIWHGASWNFVLWGSANGIVLVLEKLFKKFYFKLNGKIRWFFTTFLIINIWPLFMVDLEQAKRIYSKMYNLDLWKNFSVQQPYYTLPILLFVSIMALEHFFQPYKVNRYGFPRFNKSRLAVIFAMAFFLVAVQLVGEDLPFIYFQF